MRNISRNMTEKLARERGVTRIDLPLVEDSLSGARTTMEDVITGKVSIADLAKDTGESIEAENGGAPHPPMTGHDGLRHLRRDDGGLTAPRGVPRVRRPRARSSRQRSGISYGFRASGKLKPAINSSGPRVRAGAIL
jgi:hypothetical protein